MEIPSLILDPSLKYWVLLPISLTLLIFGLLKAELNALLTPTPKLQPLSKFKETETIKHLQLFKQNYWNLTKSSFSSRQEHYSFILTNGSMLPAEKPPQEEQTNPFSDPANSDMMLNMAKNSMGQMASQYLMMGWVNFFFAGFILMKLPFPLTVKFKQMLQNGVMTDELDVRWVSSVSWYLIATLGLESVYNVLIGDSSAANGMMQQGMQPPSFNAGGAKRREQMEAMLQAEANDLKIIEWEGVTTGVGKRLLKLYS